MSKNEGTIDDRYFEWLYREIGSVSNKNPRRSFWNLALQLYRTPFTWSVLNDDNREQDGLELRVEFIENEGVVDADKSWMDLECSMLEMLVALARRVSFESSGEPGDWFWKFMSHLGMETYTDDTYGPLVEMDVSEAIEQVINRTYDPDGTGGLFPLEHADQDQRQVELWYQMSAYLLEGHFEDFS